MPAPPGAIPKAGRVDYCLKQADNRWRPKILNTVYYMKILTIFGTRPEAIKMAPIIKRLAQAPGIEQRVCVTAQHRKMLDQVLELFQITPDYDLDVMTEDQTLSSLTGKILNELGGIFQLFRPDLILVHGDTTTTLASGLAAYYAKIAIGHVEAGLRTYDKYAPWPEEINRRLTGSLSDIHFAPTPKARENLLKEGVSEEAVHVTGNSVIDALFIVKKRLDEDEAFRGSLAARFPYLDRSKRLILVTGHRRENFGEGFEHICGALAEIARRDDVQIVYPVHLNPHVQKPVKESLGGLSNVFLIDPLDYAAFIYLLDRCHLVLTDSGGIQEEAPALGKPVLVMRDLTERPEALAAGTALLTGAHKDRIVREALRLLDDPEAYKKMSVAANPYGDGRAAEKIAAVLLKNLKAFSS